VTSHWDKKADQIVTDGAEADKGFPQELLKGGKT
jgi:hypothetical protein